MVRSLLETQLGPLIKGCRYNVLRVVFTNKLPLYTTKELLEQINRKEEQFIISEHFSRPDHDKEDLRVQILEAGASKLSWDREAAKRKWMKKLTAEDIGSD